MKKRKLVLGGSCKHGHIMTEDNMYVFPEGSSQAGAIKCIDCRKVSQSKNYNSRKVNNPAKNLPAGKRTHCPKGHPYSEENTYVTKNNKRQCRTCTRERKYIIEYGITIQDYNRMFALQGGRCAICYTEVNLELYNKKHLDIDHNHITGKVRELLCNQCNVGIARFNENVLIMEKAINYLKKHS